MRNELVKAIEGQTKTLFVNAGIMLQTCNLNFILCGMPIWKHVYHMLHSCDQWYINPNEYTEPKFHVPGLNSLDIQSDISLSREELLSYLQEIRVKVEAYLDSLSDESLYEVPRGCTLNRLGLIMGQLRHFYAHLGNINATTILETGRWPRVVGITGNCGASTQGLYE